MKQTYLQMVNAVLRRLREREVNTVQGISTSNSYARLIGDFINEAKSMVENAWEWSSLRDSITVSTVDNTKTYTLVGSNSRFEVINVINETDEEFLEYKDRQWFDEHTILTPNDKGSPKYYNFNGVDANGDAKVDFYPTPDGVYSIKFNVVKRNPTLTADADTTLIPDRPVVLFAYAMAIEERGEDSGQGSGWAYQTARDALADEVALDASRQPESTIWNSV